MKYRRGDSGAGVLNQVIRPLIERGYLTWADAGYTTDPKKGGSERINGKGGRFNEAVHQAVVQFQNDSGIGKITDASHGVDTLHPNRKSPGVVAPGSAGGVVGRRTLAALGQRTTSREVQMFVAHKLREDSAAIEFKDEYTAQRVARGIAEISNAHPHMEARVVAALGLVGYGADDPVTKSMSDLSARNANKPFWQNIEHEKGKRVPAVDQLGDMMEGGHKYAGLPQEKKDDGGGGLFGFATAIPTAGLRALGQETAADFIGGVTGAADDGLKSISRPVMSALESPMQIAEGAWRSGEVLRHDLGMDNPGAGPFQDNQRLVELERGDVVNPLAQSSGGQALSDLIGGRKVDMGEGFFPAGKVHEDMVKKQREALMVAGHAATPGRLWATAVADPDTKPYNIMSGIVDTVKLWGADPVIAVGKASSAVRAERKVFQAADFESEATGLISGFRRSLHGPTAERFLENPRTGGKFAVKAGLAPGEEGAYTFSELRKIFKGDAATAAEVYAAKGEDAVKAILRPKLGIGIRDTFKAPYEWHRTAVNTKEQFRLFGGMPGGAINLKNIDDGVEQFDRWMANGKLSLADRDKFGLQLATATGREERFNIVMAAGKKVADQMIETGVDRLRALELTQFFDDFEGMRHWINDAAGNDINVFVKAGDKTYEIAHPAKFVDFLDSNIPLPSARPIRRATSKHAELFRKNEYWNNHIKVAGQAGPLTNTADALLRVWKPVVLARPAWTVRVVGEEQVRLAATGNWRHPIHHILGLIYKSDDQTDALGTRWIDDAEEAVLQGRPPTAFMEARTGGQSAFAVDAETRLRRRVGWDQYDLVQHPRELTNAWADEIVRWHSDPVARYMAQHTPEETVEWLQHGDGTGYRLSMSGSADDPKRLLDTPEEVKIYVENMYDHMTFVTQGDKTLKDAMASGRFNDVSIAKVKNGNISNESGFVKELGDRVARGEAPEKMNGVKYAKADKAHELGDTWDRVVEAAFDALMTKPTNRLSRSPMFFKSYWKRMEELMPAMSAADRAKMIAQAEANGFHDVAAAGRKLRTQGDEAMRVTLDEADTLAKSFGLKATRQLLYDIGEKSQFFDVMRHIAPFGEAWKEVLTRWAKIASDNPEIIRRAQTVVQGARGAKIDSNDTGFFYTDPSTGQEMFNIPGSEWVTKSLLGIPIPLGGSVDGLNMVAQGTPGVGPGVQVAAGFMLPDTTEWDWLRKVIDPYGEPIDKNLGPVTAIADTFIPSWLQKGAQVAGWGPEQQRGNAIASMAAYLRTSGDYPQTPEGQKKLMQDAKDNSKWFWAIRAVGSFAAPTAPIPKFQIVNEDGKTIPFSDTVKAYYDGLNKANKQGRDITDFDKEFIGKYGLAVKAEMTPKTRAVAYLPRTVKQIAWARDNPDIVEDFPYIYGFLAPPDPDGEYDPGAAERQARSGERQFLSPDQHARAVEHDHANTLWHAATDGLDDTDEEDIAYKREVTEFLTKKYPGWRDETGLVQKADPDKQIEQAIKASKDPRFAKTKLGKGLRLYIQERDAVIAYGRKKGLTSATGWKTAKVTADERAGLLDVVELLNRKYPQAAKLVESVFWADTAADVG